MNFFTNISIRYKIVSSFFLIFLILFLFGLYLLISLNVFYQQLGKLDTEGDKRLFFARLNTDTTQLSNSVKSYILTKDPKWEKEYDMTSAKVANELSSVQTQLNPQEAKTFNDLKDTIIQAQGVELLILAKTREGNTTQAIQLFDTRYEQQQEKITSLVGTLVTNEDTAFDQTISVNSETITSARTLLVITLGIIFLLIIIIGFFVSSLIEKSIDKLVSGVKEIASGNFLVRIDAKTNDEVGILAQNINTMASQLQTVYQSVEQNVAEKTANLAQKIAEVEKLNKFMIGRELKMTELKKEIEELKKQLNKT